MSTDAAAMHTRAMTTRGPIALQADGVTVVAGGRTLVRDASLAVPAGALVAVIGPSGAGKTTLLRALAGAPAPQAGRVVLDGGVGFVPAEDLLHDELTVFEELLFAARLRAARADALAGAHSVIEELRLTALADARVATLSKGQRRRVSCGVELVGRPRVLLLDEPAGGLDIGLERRLMALLRRLADEGQSIVVATHATASLELCDAVVALAPGGVIRYRGPAGELPAALGAGSLEEVYELLDAAGDDGDTGAPPPPAAARAPSVAARSAVPTGDQFAAVVARAALCRLRDRRSLALLLGQAPVLGVAIAVVLPRGVVSDADLGPFYGMLLCMMLLTASIWLGTVAACRDLAAERAIIERELAVGVRPAGHVLAKLLTLLPLVALQTALLAVVVLVLQPVEHGAPLVAGLCVATGWTAAATGLWLSAAARTPGQAITAVPLVLIPQLLFAGALIPIDRLLPPLRLLSDAVAARWALSALGGAIDLDERVGTDVTSVTGLDPGFFAASPATPLAALAAIALISTALAVRAVARR